MIRSRGKTGAQARAPTARPDLCHSQELAGLPPPTPGPGLNYRNQSRFKEIVNFLFFSGSYRGLFSPPSIVQYCFITLR